MTATRAVPCRLTSPTGWAGAPSALCRPRYPPPAAAGGGWQTGHTCVPRWPTTMRSTAAPQRGQALPARPYTASSPVSYTHLTLPTIYSV